MKNILEQIVEFESYDDITSWHLPNISNFSESKTLFEYQINAIKNITKVLHRFYSSEDGQKKIHQEYLNRGLEHNQFSIDQQKEPRRFNLFKNYYEVDSTDNNKYISEYNLFNRACFWMATGSGKSLVIIKVIELINQLKSESLIPKNDILLLMPRDYLIEQFKKEVEDFNTSSSIKIELINLKEYDEDKQRLDLHSGIKVFYYRSDLIRDENKENLIDFKTYDNKGNWFILLDEAHRGEKQNSLAQDYISILSRNGFLFNFSATFTDKIDYLTTCYNFNLKRFIESGYGKNVYFGASVYEFKKNTNDFSENEKAVQVLKSLILFSLIKDKKRQLEDIYHWPMMMTLVNSVNTNDSDLKLYFKVISKISTGLNINLNIFTTAKEQLINELKTNRKFIFGEETLHINEIIKGIEEIEQQNIFENVFNSDNFGKIEVIEGEKGKELALKLETSEEPFALIKIGDAGKFQTEHLGNDYKINKSFDNSRSYFKELDNRNNINLLIGSRSFYEGWDSDRPNILNFINIGGKDAKKFVLQSTGRGIRIQPIDGVRKRLTWDEGKEQLLETLFIFASDKKTIKAIKETVEDEGSSTELVVSLKKNSKASNNIDLLIPVFRDSSSRQNSSKFSLSRDSKQKLEMFVNSFDEETLIVKYGLSKDQASHLLDGINKNDMFQFDDEKNYLNIAKLFNDVINFTSIKEKTVENLKLIEEEIQHYLQIKLIDLQNFEVEDFLKKIEKVSNSDFQSTAEIMDSWNSGEITDEEMASAITNLNTNSEKFMDEVVIKNISEHFYLPLIYSNSEKTNFIRNIIKVPSEVSFVEKLEKFLNENTIQDEWMFSKINENIDDVFIPYFDNAENKFRKFYPDFIFWFKEAEGYRIVFVDPKGVEHSEYMSKVEGFEKLFMQNGKNKKFEFNNIPVYFDLLLVTDNLNLVTEKFKNYWLNVNEIDRLFNREYSTK